MGLNVEALTQLFERLNRSNVRYLLIDGMACVVHGHLHTTAVVNLWIEDNPENNQAFANAVNEDTASEYQLSELSSSSGTTLRFGKSGFKLNARHSLNAFSTKDFEECHNRALTLQLGGEAYHVISLRDLITEKRASTTYSDAHDLYELEQIWNREFKAADD